MLLLSSIERLLLAIGLALLAIFFAAHIDSAISSRTGLRHFRDLQLGKNKMAVSADGESAVDFNLWSAQRIAAYQSSVTEPVGPVLAVLRIARVNLEVPVLDGTSELVLNRGVGHIPGTVLPGEEGNIGIAGHRDGFFRVLKDIGPGDMIELETKNGIDRYRVNQITIVRPNDVSVLERKPVSSLTLVTCFPFYFIGSAPQRYIVTASIVNNILAERELVQHPRRSEPGRSARALPAFENPDKPGREPIKETIQ
jgi:sortase A